MVYRTVIKKKLNKYFHNIISKYGGKGQIISINKYSFFKNPLRTWKVSFSNTIYTPSTQDTFYHSQKQKL